MSSAEGLPSEARRANRRSSEARSQKPEARSQKPEGQPPLASRLSRIPSPESRIAAGIIGVYVYPESLPDGASGPPKEGAAAAAGRDHDCPGPAVDRRHGPDHA